MTDDKFLHSGVGTGKDLKNFIDNANAAARKADSETRLRQPVDNSDDFISSADYVAKLEHEEKQRNIKENTAFGNMLTGMVLNGLGFTEDEAKEFFGGSDKSAQSSRNEKQDAVSKPQLLSTKEAADLLGVSPSTLRNWRTRELFGVPFFTADEQRGGAWYYYRERVEQLKEIYQPGILQDLYKIADRQGEYDDLKEYFRNLLQKNEDTPPSDFQKCVSSGEANFADNEDTPPSDFQKCVSSGEANFADNEDTPPSDFQKCVSSTGQNNSENDEILQINFIKGIQALDDTTTPDFQKCVSSGEVNFSGDFQKCVSREQVNSSDDIQKSPSSDELKNLKSPKGHRGYLSTEQVAEYFGVTFRAVEQWVMNGTINWDRFDHHNRWLFKVKTVEDFEARRNRKKAQRDNNAKKAAPSPVPDTADKAEPATETEPTDAKKDEQPETSPPTAELDDYHKQIAADLERAMRQMFDLPGADNRCLSDKTRASLGIYFLPNHRHPKFPNSSPSPRFIIQLGDIDDPPAYNAVLTPTGRKRFKGISPKKDKAAEKTLTAGEKLLFHPQALRYGIFFVTEGEIDAASIIQATKGNIQACALGGAGIFKDFLHRVSKLEVKPCVIILFDKDPESKTGQINAQKLQRLLADLGIASIIVFIDDFATKLQKEKLGNKIDANAILQEFGDPTLNILITKIRDHCEREFPQVQEKLRQLQAQASLPDAGADLQPLHMRQTSTATSANSGTALSDSPEYDIFRATLMLDKIAPANLDYYGWLAVISSCKNIGVDYSLVDAFNRRDSKRYDAGANQAAWNAVSDSSFDIKTLHGIAQSFGYSEADARRQWFELHPELKPKNPHITGDPVIDRWQDINGVIHPDLLPDLRSAAEKINGLEHITAAIANEISVQRRLGEFRYYSPFAAVDERFFARLRDAKSDAKKKIAAWNKDNSQPAPTDADKALATLDIAIINRKVEACLSQAKRAHQKYVDSTRRKEVADQREAEHDAYITKPPTTKDDVPDCPVELILPEGTSFTNEGISVIDTDKDDDHPISACQNPVVPTKIFREPSKHVTQYEIAIKNRNRWRRIVVDGKTIQDARYVTELNNFGAHVYEPRMLAKFFAKIIALNETNDRLEEIRAFSQPGWYGDDFTDFAYPTGGDDYVVHRAGFDFKRGFASRGNPAIWKETFIDAMNQGGAIARVFAGTALAAPLIRPLHTSNAQIHLHGGINNGKTALALLTASIFGNPREIFLTFESSIKNRLAVAAAYNDLPTFLEEMETRPSKEMEKALPQSVYSYFTGKANQANKRDGTPRDPFYFSGARLSTGERPLLSDNDQTGAFKRIVQIRCKKLFTTKFSAPLYPFTENNFGHFGRKWITFIADNHSTISETFQKLVPQFTATALHEGTQVNSVVAAAVAYQYFRICIGVQLTFDDIAARSDINAILNELPTLQDISGSERLIRALRSFVDSHPKNFVIEYKEQDSPDDTRDAEAQSYSETFGKIFLNGEVAFYPTALKKIIEKELGFASSLAHIETFNDEGKLITTNARPNQHNVIICGKYKWTIHFRAGILSEPSSDISTDYVESPPWT